MRVSNKKKWFFISREEDGNCGLENVGVGVVTLTS